MTRRSADRKPLPDLPDPLSVPVPDSHTHLDLTEQLAGLSPADTLDRAAEVGIDRVVQIGCDVASSRWSVNYAATDSRVIAAVGLHPNEGARIGMRERADGESDADDLGAEQSETDPEAALDESLAQIETLITAHDRVRAIGETGLDYFRTLDEAGLARQRRSFEHHIDWAKRFDKTLVIHDRDAHDDVVAMLDAHGWPDRVVLHCFSGDQAFAEQCLARGAFLSFPGTITFAANEALRQACRITPAERLLVETDAPFLTPKPHRGHPNASYLIPHTLRFMAEVRSVSVDELAREISAATDAAFGRW